ncbi:MAG: hypothetical protein HKO92_10555 [Flavobacteriaceae bacterium]|nr:hypothetical protein [Flavobacteriaceae bacterium]
MNFKKALKVLIGIVVFISLPSLLLFGYAYYKYHEDIPIGETGESADALANKMQNALNIEAFNNVNYISFTIRNKRHYEWIKDKNTCTVTWKDFKVELNLKNHDSSLAYMHSFKVILEEKNKLLNKALDYYQKDIFWLLAPYKAFDNGVKRGIVNNGKYSDALLITHPKSDNLPVESYLWILDENGKPEAMKMWGNSTPIDGIEASWNNWTTIESGAILPTFHKIFMFGIEISNIKTKP